ncbi:BQ2448_6269 [Microbotryum intermedium]|uniref:ATP phosphoribosyltransferase n=1 Tax=Microbotryum intermedium TaxID=269621 RepID=A0A238FM31_9BASI|nr:BQ2448_6269 [Microbotryum intermedium]
MSDFLNESLKGRTLFAIPKKGRLYEKCLELLAGADIQFTRSHRLDVCLVRNHNMALVFLPAADIPRFVGEGNVHLGITGQDMVAEASAQKLVTEVLPLGFGKCKLQIQVPEKGPIKTVEDLVGKKIVTSFEVLAGQYFDELDHKVGGGAGEKKKRTLIEYVGGSVEAACALGLADGIVDLVESGETMRAAGLTAISTLLASQAVLIRSNKPSDTPTTSLITRITSRIAGVIAAGRYVLVQYNIRRNVVDEATKITPGRRAATVSPLDDPEWVAVSSMVLKAEVADAMDRLQAIGAADILNIGLTNCRVD